MQDFIITGVNNMKIAVLSGKGGTGKTLVSVNLASSAKKSTYIDCDVEEPNGHLFFKPKDIISEDINIKIPLTNNNLCNGCRKCVDFCKFNALAYVKNKVMVFDDICHSCGGCMLFCPTKAISEKDKKIGEVQKGISGDVTVITGMLNTGEASGVPIIKRLLNNDINNGANYIEEELTFIDCPPGSACVVMESIKDADYCILVAEPTTFGVHNLEMVYELVKIFNKQYGVVLNKCMDEDNPAEKFCLKNNIKILGKIPFESELGTLNSNAFIAVRENERYKNMFLNMLQDLIKEVQNETIVNP